MADNSAIEWTDATWNPIVGCSVISPGCTHCYAMTLAGTRLKNHPSREGLTVGTKAGPVWNGQVRLIDKALDQPLRWKRPRKIFVCAHGDLFHPEVPLEWIVMVFGVAIASVHLRGHVLQVLTKRADRMIEALNDDRFWDHVNADASMHVMERVDPLNRRSDDARATLDDYGPDNPPPGIWLGVSTEDQQRYDERAALLRDTPAVVRFFSMEPLLGPIEADYLGDWVIVGGESGKDARPMHPDWARSLRDQCQASGVPFFFKQWGEWRLQPSASGDETWPAPWRGDQPPKKDDIAHMVRLGKKAAGAELDGREWREFPA